MTLEGVDYSFSKPGGAALQSAGMKFAVRYLSNNMQKGLQTKELTDLTTHGIAVALVYEEAGNRALYGSTFGSNDATSADKLRNNLSLPALPIYFAVDFDANAGQMNNIIAYFKGVEAVLGHSRTGVYGSYAVITALKAAGVCTYYWQTYAWSAGKVASGIHLYQYKNGQTINNASVDFDQALQLDYGQFPQYQPVVATPVSTALGHIDGVNYMRIDLGFPANLISGKADTDYFDTDIAFDTVVSGPDFDAAVDHWDASPDLQGVNVNGKLRVKMPTARPAGAAFGFHVVVTE